MELNGVPQKSQISLSFSSALLLSKAWFSLLDCGLGVSTNEVMAFLMAWAREVGIFTL
jgi:hypothetical protein